MSDTEEPHWEAMARVNTLTTLQRNVVAAMSEKGPFSRGRSWAYDTPSNTERVMEALERKGIVTCTTTTDRGRERRTFHLDPAIWAYHKDRRRSLEIAQRKAADERHAQANAERLDREARRRAAEELVGRYPEEFNELVASIRAQLEPKEPS